MTAMACNWATLTVVLVYWCWRMQQQALLHRLRVRRERVAWLLWVMAGRTDEGDDAVCETSLEPR